MKKMISILTCSITILISPAFSQETEENSSDPFANDNDKVNVKKAKKPPEDRQGVTNLSHCYEVFSLPLAQAAFWQRQKLSDTELYKRMVDGLTNNTVIQENYTIMRLRSGEKSSSNAIVEYIYPTEYAPGKIPNSVGIAFTSPQTMENKANTTTKKAIPSTHAERLKNAPPLDSLSGIKTFSVPTSFETRHLGDSFEISSAINDSGTLVDLRIYAEHVKFVENTPWGQGQALVEQPEFETQSLKLGITAHVGRPVMLGTLNRTPDSKIDPNSANKVFYAFMTVSVAKP